MTQRQTVYSMLRRAQSDIGWWIVEGGFLHQGGKKRLGPFVTKHLAEIVRGYIEREEGHESLYLDEVTA